MNKQMHDTFAVCRLMCLLGLILIYSTIGTAHAQVDLMKDFYPGGSGFARYVFDTGADVFYIGLYTDTGTMELWKSDGTEAGTAKVKEFRSIESEPRYRNYAYSKGYFYFFAEGLNDGGVFLYATDGTAVGTKALKDQFSNRAPQARMHVFDGSAYAELKTEPASAYQLFKLDGGNLTQITSLEVGVWHSAVATVGGDLYFAHENLYRYDGSTVTNLWIEHGYANSYGSAYYKIAKRTVTGLGKYVIFHAYSSSGQGVYAFDTETNELTLLTKVDPNTAALLAHERYHSQAFHVHGDHLYFILPDPEFTVNSGNHERAKRIWLWKTDGTRSGTVQLHEFVEYAEPSPNPIAPVTLQGSTATHLFIRSWLNDEEYPADYELHSFDFASEGLARIDGDIEEEPFRGQNTSSRMHFFADRADPATGWTSVSSTDGVGEARLHGTARDLGPYNVRLDGGSAILHDSLYYFVGYTEATSADVFVLNRHRTSTAAVDPHTPVPSGFALHQNYPNPFNPSTQIAFDLPDLRHVRIEAYDLLGRRVALLADRSYTAGRHDLRFDAADLPSGVYLYRITAGAETQSRTMTVLQ